MSKEEVKEYKYNCPACGEGFNKSSTGTTCPHCKIKLKYQKENKEGILVGWYELKNPEQKIAKPQTVIKQADEDEFGNKIIINRSGYSILKIKGKKNSYLHKINNQRLKELHCGNQECKGFVVNNTLIRGELSGRLCRECGADNSYVLI